MWTQTRFCSMSESTCQMFCLQLVLLPPYGQKVIKHLKYWNIWNCMKNLLVWQANYRAEIWWINNCVMRKAIWDIQSVKTKQMTEQKETDAIDFPWFQCRVRQQRVNRRICDGLVYRGAAGAPRGPPATWAADSTDTLPADLHFAALAGKVVLASCSWLTALTRHLWMAPQKLRELHFWTWQANMSYMTESDLLFQGLLHMVYGLKMSKSVE